MQKGRLLFARTALLLLVAFCFVSPESQAGEQTVAFKVTGTGIAPNGLPLDGTVGQYNAGGNATHVGKYGAPTNQGLVQLTGPGTFKGSFVFVAQNGDKLACTHGDKANNAKTDGTFEVIPVSMTHAKIKFVAEFNPIVKDCTGRFKDITGGSWIMIAVTEPIPFPPMDPKKTAPFTYSWSGEGKLTFAKGKN